MEESIYRGGGRVNYIANRFGVDVLTDTTERSPTYCTPPFRKFDDATASESWAFLFVPHPTTEQAWEHILKRKPQCLEWTKAGVENLVDVEKLPRILESLKRITRPELMRFKIGLDGLKYRPVGKADGLVAVIAEEEKDGLLKPDGFYRSQLEAAHKAGAKIGFIFFGREAARNELRDFLAAWKVDVTSVLVPVPERASLLDGATRFGVKLLLNALSTCTMVRLGRVMGNYMIYVVPSNLKLIDRSTRYIQKLAGLDYPSANRLLFEVIEYVEPRMRADQAYPPVVGLAVTRARNHLTNEAAESQLARS
jgi:N-acetylmuramic acid 6-phosphate etherase